MALPSPSLRQLLEAGVHFGHTTRRWNPRMAPFIFGTRNGVHIIDLEQTLPLLNQALLTVRNVVAGGGRVLFVGRSEEHTSELQSLMRISYAVFCLKKKKSRKQKTIRTAVETT